MIRPHSKARQKQLREYCRKRQIYLLCNPVCRVHSIVWGGADVGLHYAKEIHHTYGRVGSLLLDEKFWKPVCRECHNWIGAHPKAARERGLIAPLGQWNQTEKLRQQKERNANQAR